MVVKGRDVVRAGAAAAVRLVDGALAAAAIVQRGRAVRQVAVAVVVVVVADRAHGRRRRHAGAAEALAARQVVQVLVLVRPRVPRPQQRRRHRRAPPPRGYPHRLHLALVHVGGGHGVAPGPVGAAAGRERVLAAGRAAAGLLGRCVRHQRQQRQLRHRERCTQLHDSGRRRRVQGQHRADQLRLKTPRGRTRTSAPTCLRGTPAQLRLGQPRLPTAQPRKIGHTAGVSRARQLHAYRRGARPVPASVAVLAHAAPRSRWQGAGSSCYAAARCGGATAQRCPQV